MQQAISEKKKDFPGQSDIDPTMPVPTVETDAVNIANNKIIGKVQGDDVDVWLLIDEQLIKAEVLGQNWSLEVTPTMASDGMHNVQAFSQKKESVARSEASDIKQINVDLHAPQITVDGYEDGFINLDQDTTIRIKTEPNAQVTVVDKQSAVLFTKPSDAEGYVNFDVKNKFSFGQEIRFQAVDAAGNKGDFSKTYNIDKSPPKVSLDGDEYINHDEASKVVITTEPNTKVSVVWNDLSEKLTVTSDAQGHAVFNLLSKIEPIYQFSTPLWFQATDYWGHKGEISRRYILDTVAPKVDIGKYLYNYVSSAQKKAFEVKTEANATVEILEINEGKIKVIATQTSNAQGKAVFDLSGDHEFRIIQVRATDAAKNVGELSDQLIIAPPQYDVAYKPIHFNSLVCQPGTMIDVISGEGGGVLNKIKLVQVSRYGDGDYIIDHAPGKTIHKKDFGEAVVGADGTWRLQGEASTQEALFGTVTFLYSIYSPSGALLAEGWKIISFDPRHREAYEGPLAGDNAGFPFPHNGGGNYGSPMSAWPEWIQRPVPNSAQDSFVARDDPSVLHRVHRDSDDSDISSINNELVSKKSLLLANKNELIKNDSKDDVRNKSGDEFVKKTEEKKDTAKIKNDSLYKNILATSQDEVIAFAQIKPTSIKNEGQLSSHKLYQEDPFHEAHMI